MKTGKDGGPGSGPRKGGGKSGLAAASAIHKQIYTPAEGKYHTGRSRMAANLREARSTGLRGPGKSAEAAKFATSHAYTGVKGAHFVDQGLGGKVWGKNVPSWAGKPAKGKDETPAYTGRSLEMNKGGSLPADAAPTSSGTWPGRTL